MHAVQVLIQNFIEFLHGTTYNFPEVTTVHTANNEDTMFKYAMMCMVLLLMLAPVSAQGTTTDYDLSDELQADIASIEDNTENLRGLQPLSDVTLRFPTREELSDYLRTTLASEMTDELVAQSQAFYAAFGFISADVDLMETILSLYEDQVAGFYDPEIDEMNVILMTGSQPDDELPLLDSIIYSHEYVHALQDQHFDLQALLEDVDPAENADAFLARQALAEGDATLIMNQYTEIAVEEDPLGSLVEILRVGAQTGNLTLPEGLPPILGEELTWPYLTGAAFVAELYERGGWDAVNAAYENPPQSTEQIYHPQRYFDGDMPVETSVDTETFDGWEIATDGVFGEFYLRQYLGQYISPADVRQSATGWGGDAYVVYRQDTDDVPLFAWEMTTLWDTETDADEFMQAMQDVAAAYPMQALTDNGSQTGSCFESTDSGEVLCLSRENATQTRLTFAPGAAMAIDLLVDEDAG
jgi:hypothetical protein